MNFLEIVKGVRGRVGMQGTGPSSVLTATSAEMDLVNAVHDAWVDIQNFREEWRWMRAEATFSTVIGKKSYTIFEIFSTASDRFKNWRRVPVYIFSNGQWSEIKFIDYDVYNYRTQNDTGSSQPKFYTVRKHDNAILINTPDSVYQIKIGYQKGPQRLVNNADIPELPVSYHLSILYLAVEKYSSIVASTSSELYYQQLNDFCIGQLMRSQLDKKRVRIEGIA